MEVTLGGERLGAGKRNKIWMHNYERSTHDLSYVMRTTMSAGTLVPFMSELALPGDTFDIDLDVDVLTHPTIGPLFGSYKIQLDVFQVPIRLYQSMLHMNMLGIGMNMSSVKLPLIKMEATPVNQDLPLDNQHVNPSCIFKYLGISGVGQSAQLPAIRKFNAIPYLAYWDIYKNYYANKQEEIGAVIHRAAAPATALDIVAANILNPNGTLPLSGTTLTDYLINGNTYIQVEAVDLALDSELENVYIKTEINGEEVDVRLMTIFPVTAIDLADGMIFFRFPTGILPRTIKLGAVTYSAGVVIDGIPKVTTFDLNNIDDMRLALLQAPPATAYEIDRNSPAPYGLPLNRYINTVPTPDEYTYSQQFGQEGLALKTYNSDLFNNWISTEWIDGENGVAAVTAIDTSGGSFTIDEFNLSSKIYKMLSRIAVSGGTYDDWLDAVYTHDRQKSAENPMYLGGLIDRLVFQEVISNAATENEPLGSLAGRGRVANNRKGGKIVAKVDEPSYLMGIVSLTPYLDYSQGNKWDTNLKTMDDLHKPALDEIGFQDLITDQMAWWDTTLDASHVVTYRSAGKQPAWINYMTNVNRVYGNFADEAQQMFMVLNRRYEPDFEAQLHIKDLTTYIDPSHFNHIFADTRLDAQNFWTQIKVDMIARRKMSAKVIPNL